ncbi:hypothetical protein CCACVL1_16533 [Corchorus capsularis]|uniref:KIB1-4 beta-propeller domain-containing protein n=1 Tax=Corchorus capsularis TaxID=210143 RepID=A0A1R3HWR4_COCAP|nr:hypothetical protein CCACVL1_16533 [Corchorus capsularis]
MANLEASWANLPKDCLSIVLDRKSHRKKKLYSLQNKREVSDIKLRRRYTKRCCGSCYGWIASVDKEFVITLSNPFKDVPNIDLPKLEFPEKKPMGHQYDIQKVVLSADPCSSPTSFVVGVIYSVYCRLAFHRYGDKDKDNWIHIDNNLTLITDLIFHRNLVYVIGHRNNVLSFDINGPEPPKLKTLLEEDHLHDGEAYSDRAYLVESSMGNLFSIHRKLKSGDNGYSNDYLTKRFRVMKMVLDENGELLEREEVKSIDGDLAFVGDNGSLTVAAKYFPQGQPNSIYYTDDYFDIGPYVPFGPRDNGIFHLEDGSFEQHYQFQSSHKRLPPYIWICPPIHYVLQLGS